MITVEYMLVDDLPSDRDFDVQEDRGRVEIRVRRTLPLDRIFSGLNQASRAILAGGHWFQEWKGDIITMETPAGRLLPPQRDPGTDYPQSDAA